MDNRIKKFFLGRGYFKTADEVIDIVAQSDNFDSSNETKVKTDALLIFQTLKQQTWLVSSTKRLYCVLDDIDKGFTKIQWSIPSHELCLNGKIIANISTQDKTRETGLLNLNERKNWLFSKKLFTLYGVESSIRDLILRTMN